MDVDRRGFLKTSAGLSSLAAASLLGGCGSLLTQIQNRPTRRGSQSLPDNDPVWDIYEAAVQAMRALPGADGRNWEQQAQIHLDHCPHGNWFFLPWHRAYLFYFEQICKELAADDSFALPYWNWNANREIPTPFWSGGLSHPRNVGPTSQANAAWVGDPALNAIYALNNFTLFGSGASTTQRGFSSSGELESTPHNNIHGWIGQDMGTYVSPRDPIFWLHHCMIDCMWWHWNADLGNPNTNDPVWTNFNFVDNFFDRDGVPASMTSISTVILPITEYRYEPCHVGATAADMGQRDREDLARLRSFLEEGAEVPTGLEAVAELARGDAAFDTMVLPQTAIRGALEGRAPHVVVEIDVDDPPSDEIYYLRLFVDLPDASPRTPITDPHYAGALGFFEDPQAHAGHDGPAQTRFRIDIGPTLKRLSELGQLPDRVTLQLVATPFAGREDGFVEPRSLVRRVQVGLMDRVRTRFDEE